MEKHHNVFDETFEKIYLFIGIIFGFLTFLGAWIYAFSASGFVLGFVIGWIPALALALIAFHIGKLTIPLAIGLAFLYFAYRTIEGINYWFPSFFPSFLIIFILIGLIMGVFLYSKEKFIEIRNYLVCFKRKNNK